MDRKKLFHLFKIVVVLFTLVFCYAQGSVWAGHDQGQGKSQHPDHEVAVAPEPSGLLLFTVGGMIVAYRCRKKKKR
jgi:hypothetical protein